MQDSNPCFFPATTSFWLARIAILLGYNKADMWIFTLPLGILVLRITRRPLPHEAVSHDPPVDSTSFSQKKKSRQYFRPVIALHHVRYRHIGSGLDTVSQLRISDRPIPARNSNRKRDLRLQGPRPNRYSSMHATKLYRGDGQCGDQLLLPSICLSLRVYHGLQPDCHKFHRG